jgi:hypothetical protein
MQRRNHGRTHFSVRQNGERVGRPFPSWDGASDSLYRLADRIHCQTQRAGSPFADCNGVAKRQLLAHRHNGARTAPRPELRVDMRDAEGNPIRLELKRER